MHKKFKGKIIYIALIALGLILIFFMKPTYKKDIVKQQLPFIVTFETGFESNEVQPVEFDYPDVNNNIIGYKSSSKPICSTITNKESHSGKYALRYEGTANGDKENNIKYRLFEEKINITEDTVLDYWIYPEQNNGRFVGIDFLCTDGTTLRDSGAVDKGGQSLHPSAGHGGNLPLNTWSEISSNVGQWLKGKTIDSISLIYDHSGAKGGFSGYIDDIKIYNSSNDVTVGPGNPDIKYFGRWDNSLSTTYNSYYGGAYFKVNFNGTTAKLKLAGPSNIYVRIDDGKDILYSNASGIVDLTQVPLSKGEHSLRVTAPSQNDVIRFNGLILDKGAETRQPIISSNLIEFIGDSITEGYTTSNECLSDYAWKTGEKLNVEHTQIAYVGICLSDNVRDVLNHNIGMNTSYFKLQPTEKYPYSPAWDFSRYKPNIIVINLGTNDFAAKVPDSDFQATYKKFLISLREKQPNAEIFVLRTFGSPAYKDGFLAVATLGAVNERISSGDNKVHYIDTNGWLTDKSDFNDELHPSETGHDKVAEKLAKILKP